MVSVAQFGLNWIVCVIVLFLFKRFDCSGVVEVHLNSSVCYKDVGVNRRCCAGSGTGVMGTTAKPCTRELFMCLVKGIEDDVPCLSENYTLSIQDYCNHTLNSTTSLHFGVPWLGTSLRVSMYIGSKHECKLFHPVLIETIPVALFTSVRRPQPSSFGKKIIPDILHLNHSEIAYQYSVYCDENFYGRCDKYCVPGNTTTTCSKEGTHICKAGWTGNNCTIQTCLIKGCQNNGSCVNDTCVCHGNRNYIGIFCETRTADILSEASPTKFPQTSTLSERGEENYHGDKAAMYAGIGVGVVLVVALVADIAYWLFRKTDSVGQFKISDEERQKQDSDDSDLEEHIT